MNNIIIDSVSYSYGEENILQDISFSVAVGEFVCLVGPSGCGKSTLLRLIAGLEDMQSGTITIGDKVINDLPARKRNVGLVFQHPSLFPHLSVRDNINFGLHKLNKDKQQTISNRLIDMIDMQKQADYFPHQLSGGQQQRVALARALAPNPQVMLLDEPFANLDHKLRREMRDEVLAMLKSTNIPTIMVTHDPEEALIMGDQMVLLADDGKVHQIGPPEEIYNNPVDIQAASFFGMVNIFPGCIEKNKVLCSLGKLSKNDLAPDIDDGTVNIIVRPEGLKMANKGNQSTSVNVESFSYSGTGWLITASLPDGQIINYYHTQGPRPQTGDSIRLELDMQHVFVFGG